MGGARERGEGSEKLPSKGMSSGGAKGVCHVCQL
jgi:hypothetical protein